MKSLFHFPVATSGSGGSGGEETKGAYLEDGYLVIPDEWVEEIDADGYVIVKTQYAEIISEYLEMLADKPKISVIPLSATQNTTYIAPHGKAYSPVNVNVPVPFDDIFVGQLFARYWDELNKKLTLFGSGQSGWSMSHQADVEILEIREGVRRNGEVINCPELKEIYIPNSIESFQGENYVNLPKLESVYYNGTAEEWAEIYKNRLDTIPNANNNCLIYFNNVLPTEISLTTISEIYQASFQNQTNLVNVTVGDNCKIIEANSFKNCSNIETVTMTEGLERVGRAFDGCTKISTFKFPKSIRFIANYAFPHLNYDLLDFTEVELVDGAIPIQFGIDIAYGIKSDAVILFATKEIADVAKVTTNLSVYASKIHYVGEVY